jgi:hypothetical protein
LKEEGNDMGVLFERSVDGFLSDPAIRIANKRLLLTDYKYLVRADLTFQPYEKSCMTEYPYLENLGALKQLLPIPAFLLRPLNKYRLPYELFESSEIHFHGQKTVIYIHGSGSISEDNSILHRLLLQNHYDLIRLTYHIDYEKESIVHPKKAEEMLPFLADIETKIAPLFNDELKSLLTKLKNDYPVLFENKEVILVAHSLGGGLAANLIASIECIQFSKFINLDGTLMNPAINAGINTRQLHLSQDRLFKKAWIDEETFTDPTKAIGQDYCKNINSLICHSTDESIWIQIKKSSHFTFTDFPNLLKPYKILRKFSGNRATADRIRKYILKFILEPNDLKIDHEDCIIKI